MKKLLTTIGLVLFTFCAMSQAPVLRHAFTTNTATVVTQIVSSLAVAGSNFLGTNSGNGSVSNLNINHSFIISSNLIVKGLTLHSNDLSLYNGAGALKIELNNDGTATFNSSAQISFSSDGGITAVNGTHQLLGDGSVSLAGGVFLINTGGQQTNSSATYGTAQTNSGTIQAAGFVGNGAGVTNVNPNGTVGITIDGGGSAITTGSKGYIRIPYAGTVADWYILADQSGSIVVDVKKCNYAGFPTTSSIAGTEKPTLSTAQNNRDISLTSFTTAVAADDIWEFNVDSASTVTRANITFKILR